MTDGTELAKNVCDELKKRMDAIPPGPVAINAAIDLMEAASLPTKIHAEIMATTRRA